MSKRTETAAPSAMQLDREFRQRDRLAAREHRATREVERVAEHKAWRKREARERRIAAANAKAEADNTAAAEAARLQPMVDAAVKAALAERAKS
jgi:membrane protein involved in colicin uptake